MGTTVLVASILDDGQVFHEKRTPASLEGWERSQRGLNARTRCCCQRPREATDRPSPPARQSPWSEEREVVKKGGEMEECG